MIQTFPGNNAVYVSCHYSKELPCKKSRKSLEPFSRKTVTCPRHNLYISELLKQNLQTFLKLLSTTVQQWFLGSNMISNIKQYEAVRIGKLFKNHDVDFFHT